MTRPSAEDSQNPFNDPVDSQSQGQSNVLADNTLVVGRDVSLTLGADSLVVLDESFVKRTSANCCGLIPNRSKPTKAVPFFNVLWVTLAGSDLTIQYAQVASKSIVRAASFHYIVEKPSERHAVTWVARLLDRAYGDSQRQKRIKVLINPFGGQGAAQKYYTRDIEPIFAAARCEIDIERTQHQGHAVQIAEAIDIEAYDVIASCSGDGLPHEVFNGLGKRRDARRALHKIAVVQLPCGTGNAMSWNLNGTDSCSHAALCIVKGIRTPLDLVSVTQAQGDTRTLSFLSQSLGIVAETDLGTDNLRWMGSFRFTYGFLARIFGKTVYPCDIDLLIEVPTKSKIKEHHRAHLDAQSTLSSPTATDSHRLPSPTLPSHPNSSPSSDLGLPPLLYGPLSSPLPPQFTTLPIPTLGNFYAGNMPLMAPSTNMFPYALPSDGLLDVFTVRGDIPRHTALRTFLSVDDAGKKFFETEHVVCRKVRAYRVRPRRPGGEVVSVDGEMMRGAAEGWAGEVHQGLGMTLSRKGGGGFEGSS